MLNVLILALFLTCLLVIAAQPVLASQSHTLTITDVSQDPNQPDAESALPINKFTWVSDEPSDDPNDYE